MAVTLGDAVVWIRGDRSKLGKDLSGAEGETRGWTKRVGGNIKSALGAATKLAIAGTATSVVALGGAFLKLGADGAQLSLIKESFAGLAEAAGVGEREMLTALEEGSAGMIKQRDLMESFNKAAGLVSNDFATTLPDAMQYMTKIAGATGQDLDFLLDSYVTGIGRLSPMILDNLQIQVSQAEATERAAEMFGVAAEELSKEQIQMGMANVVLEKMKDNTAALPEVTGTAAQQMAKFKATLANTKDAISLAVLPAFTVLMTAVTSLAVRVLPVLVEAFEQNFMPALELVWGFIQAELLPLLMEFGPTILNVVGFFSPLLMIFRLIRGDFDAQVGPIVAWLQEMLPVALQMAAEFWTGTLVPAIQAVAVFVQEVLIPALVRLVEFLQGVLQVVVAEVSAFLMDMLGVVVVWVQENWPLIQQTVETVMTAVRETIQAVLAAIVAFWEAHGAKLMGLVSSSWETMKAVIEAAIRTVGAIIKAVMEAINGDWTAAWATIRGIVELWKPAVESIIQTAMEFITLAINTGLKAAGLIVEFMMDKMEMLVLAAWEAIPGIIEAAIGLLKGAINVGLGVARDLVVFAMDSMKDAAVTVWEAIPGLFEAGIDKAKGFISGATGAFRSAGAAVVEALKQGIEGAWAGLTGWFDDRLKDLTDKLPFSEPKKPSPLRGLGKAGEAYVGNILAGMERKMPDMERAVQGMLGGMGAAAGAGAGAGPGGPGLEVTFNYRGQVLDEGQVRRDIRLTQQLTRGA